MRRVFLKVLFSHCSKNEERFKQSIEGVDAGRQFETYILLGYEDDDKLSDYMCQSDDKDD